MVVEDDLNLLEGIRSILEIEHYGVLTAQDGDEALQLLRNGTITPDLIVSDIMMPHMSGIELLEEVRRVREWVSIPFIFLTAKGEKTDIQQAKLLGVDDYVTKPYDPVDLLVAIESRLDRHQSLNAAHEGALEKLKREILTILNHEFRTPLTFVVAYSDLLNVSDLQQMEPAEIISFLQGISTGADRLRSLIENFITLVEFQTGEAARTYSWRKHVIKDFGAMMENVRAEVFNTSKVEHECRMRIAPDIPPFIADEEYLRRALYHLLSNAIKFSSADRPVDFSAVREGNDLIIRVKDYGRGIPSRELHNIWHSFHQIDRATHEDQGTGSGLAIVKGVVELHGGRVEVESRVGVGSTFTIHLPLNRS